MSWHVYIVRCADDSLYTGIALDVARRVAEHNGDQRALGARYTRGRRPVRLVYQEAVASRSLAARREAQIKRLSRTAKERLADQAASIDR
ncbi:MAG: GIY-YIG nuclease family protein [Gammaproteobacteria bacterium]|nr:GIY-YIG nuclease family protein [Gammaproteobacteria bacterium]MDH3465958.1 GIY-YIG nuclease family protein [Gammaproteobacteria bacterium]